MGFRKPGFQRLALVLTSCVSLGTSLSPQAWQRVTEPLWGFKRLYYPMVPKHRSCLLAASVMNVACIWILPAWFIKRLMHFCALWVRGGKGMENSKKRLHEKGLTSAVPRQWIFNKRTPRENELIDSTRVPHALLLLGSWGWEAKGFLHLPAGRDRGSLLARMSHHNYRLLFHFKSHHFKRSSQQLQINYNPQSDLQFFKSAESLKYRCKSFAFVWGQEFSKIIRLVSLNKANWN